MRKLLSKKLFVIILTLIFINTLNIFSGKAQIYAQEDSTNQENLVSVLQIPPTEPPKEFTLSTAAQTENTNTLYVVSLDGAGDFSSIREAVNFAKNGDILVIYPGIYYENVDIIDKELHIIGVDRDSCILQYDATSYSKVPLAIGAGSVSNLTIYGISNDTQKLFLSVNEMAVINTRLAGNIEAFDNFYTGYAVHIDQNILFGKKLSFQNCRIISENSYCIGIGSRGNSKIQFENCEIISQGSGGCIYLHDLPYEMFKGDVNFALKNCSLTNYKSPYVLTIDCLSPLNPTYLTFENVRVSSVVYDKLDCYVPNNINTGFDVDTLFLLDQANLLEHAGFTSTVMNNIVHELDMKESNEYMTSVEEIAEANDFLISPKLLPEGITYVKNTQDTDIKTDKDSDTYQNTNLKKCVFNFQNADGQAGNGWCGLDYVYLTPESHGNTLIEMNSPIVLEPEKLPDEEVFFDVSPYEQPLSQPQDIN